MSGFMTTTRVQHNFEGRRNNRHRQTPEECSREREQGSPGKAGMADEHDSNSIEPTIGIGDKHYKTILEDVRGTTRSSCFFNVGGEEADFNPEIRSMFPAYQMPYGSHNEMPLQSTGPPAYPQNIQGPMYTNVTAGRRTPVSPVSNQSADMHYDNVCY
ncbi:hypothetical protein QZH41_019281 [Actinostola sp. cb2023]|nr:hypothetical protein QZH41_019281 [Actinostola sp. cb2023]